MMLATGPEFSTRTGGYYRSLQHRESPIDFDAKLSERLWQISQDLTGADL
jgi:hypothetical protein